MTNKGFNNLMSLSFWAFLLFTPAFAGLIVYIPLSLIPVVGPPFAYIMFFVVWIGLAAMILVQGVTED